MLSNTSTFLRNLSNGAEIFLVGTAHVSKLVMQGPAAGLSCLAATAGVCTIMCCRAGCPAVTPRATWLQLQQQQQLLGARWLFILNFPLRCRQSAEEVREMIRLVKPSSVMVELCPQASVLRWAADRRCAAATALRLAADRPACTEDQFWMHGGRPSCKPVHTWDCSALHVNSALLAAAPGAHAACGAPASRAGPGARVHAGALQRTALCNAALIVPAAAARALPYSLGSTGKAGAHASQCWLLKACCHACRVANAAVLAALHPCRSKC